MESSGWVIAAGGAWHAASSCEDPFGESVVRRAFPEPTQEFFPIRAPQREGRRRHQALEDVRLRRLRLLDEIVPCREIDVLRLAGGRVAGGAIGGQDIRDFRLVTRRRTVARRDRMVARG